MSQKIKIKKIRYAKQVPGLLERHCVAFFTQSRQIIIINGIREKNVGVWPFYNAKDAERFAEDVMKGKKQSTRFSPLLLFAGVLAAESTKYDDNLVLMAKEGKFVNVAVIENIPDSVEDLESFALRALRDS